MHGSFTFRMSMTTYDWKVLHFWTEKLCCMPAEETVTLRLSNICRVTSVLNECHVCLDCKCFILNVMELDDPPYRRNVEELLHSNAKKDTEQSEPCCSTNASLRGSDLFFLILWRHLRKKRNITNLSILSLQFRGHEIFFQLQLSSLWASTSFCLSFIPQTQCTSFMTHRSEWNEVSPLLTFSVQWLQIISIWGQLLTWSLAMSRVKVTETWYVSVLEWNVRVFGISLIVQGQYVMLLPAFYAFGL